MSKSIESEININERLIKPLEYKDKIMIDAAFYLSSLMAASLMFTGHLREGILLGGSVSTIEIMESAIGILFKQK